MNNSFRYEIWLRLLLFFANLSLYIVPFQATKHFKLLAILLWEKFREDQKKIGTTTCINTVC